MQCLACGWPLIAVAVASGFLKGRQDGCKNHPVAPLLCMQSVELHLDNGSAGSD